MMRWIKRRLDLWAMKRALKWDKEYLRANERSMSPQVLHLHKQWIEARERQIEEMIQPTGNTR